MWYKKSITLTLYIDEYWNGNIINIVYVTNEIIDNNLIKFKLFILTS
jgi:hypothetical protein